MRQALRIGPRSRSGRDIVEAGLVQGLEARGGLVQFAIAVPRARAREMEPLRQAAEKAVAGVPGVTRRSTARRDRAEPGAPPRRLPPPPGHGHATAQPAGQRRRMLLPEVKKIVAVASGKGGVGKSTTAVNLAVALARQGLQVGLLDADIYGPSMPHMLGIAGQAGGRGRQHHPAARWGLKVMSIGFLVDAETPMIWRGPMVMGALEQMLGQVAWGALDIMVVDMPPGTGDAQLTMSQRCRSPARSSSRRRRTWRCSTPARG